ncbi:MAG: TonB-dependent receptor [Gemmatimonadaceae bacterium]|nr:TonB-dependent receptor [Gemmatimonadaceae bacterium]
MSQPRHVATLTLLLATLTGAHALRAQVVRGTVEGRGAQATAVIGAEVTAIASGLRTRTDERGRFSVLAGPGDSLRIRALGFRERRIAVTGTLLRVQLDAVPAMLDRVVTTVGQREIRVGDSPASVAVLTRADIDVAAASSANQLLRRLPGLQEIASPPAQTSIAIRGLDQSRVLVLVDGEPMAGAMTENRDIGRLSTLAAERIEVVKGPSSVEYGSEALGGVINLVTAAPSVTGRLDATVRTGGLGRRESSLELSDTYGPLGVRFTGGWRESDRVTAIDASATTLDRVYDFRSDARLRLAERVLLRGDLSWSQQRQRWPVGAGFNGFIDNRALQGFVELQSSTLGGQWRARVFSQGYTYQFREALGLLPVRGSADSLEQREQLTRALLAYTTAIGTRSGSHTIDAGAQLSRRRIRSPGKIDGDVADDRVAELFARDAWALGSVVLTAGARASRSGMWGNAFSPSTGATWQPAPSWRLRANVARGFRAPSFKELRYTFINGAAGYQITGNRDLRPESSWSTSTGVTWAPRSDVTIEVEAYRNALTNLIATRATGVNAAGLIVYQNINVDRARTAGVETGLRITQATRELVLGYDHLRARDLATGATLDGRAQHTARAALSQRWPSWRDLTTDLAARYTGSAPRGTERLAGFLSVDAQLRLPLPRALELSLAATNLLDARPAGWTAAWQRQLTVGLRGRFQGN